MNWPNDLLAAGADGFEAVVADSIAAIKPERKPMPKIVKQAPQGAPAPAVNGQATPANVVHDDAWGSVAAMRVLLYGVAGCLSGDTFISYQIRDKNGKHQNDKGGSLELLYRRFNNLHRPGKGYYQRKQTIGSSYYVTSVTDEGRIIRNLVTDVLDSGDRQVFEIVTESGKRIKATANHEFMTEFGYAPLGVIQVGDTIMVAPPRRQAKSVKTKRRPPYRPEVLVKNHKRKRLKTVEGGYTYCRLPRAHFIYEAARNGMTAEAYRVALNEMPNHLIEEMWVVPEGAEVHHKDENPLNDVPDNLVLVESSAEHQRLYHSEKASERIAVYAVPDKVVAITKLGVERVYDICVADPYRNFVAAGFAVHNSGKTSLWATAPGPTLAIICSGGRKPGELRSIDTPENRKKIKPVIVSSTDQLRDVLAKQAPGFATVVLDHLTGLQDLDLKEVLGIDAIPAVKTWGFAAQEQYGATVRHCAEYLRELLNLPGNVIVVAQERIFDNKQDSGSELTKPSVGADVMPSLRRIIEPWFDFVLNTYTEPRVTKQKVTGPDGTEEEISVKAAGVNHCLRIEEHDLYRIKVRRVGRAPLKNIVDPTWDKLVKAIKA